MGVEVEVEAQAGCLSARVGTDRATGRNFGRKTVSLVESVAAEVVLAGGMGI